MSKKCSRYVSLIELVQYEVEDYFVSDLAQNALYVGVTLWTELEIEVEYVPSVELRDFPGGETPTLTFLYVYPACPSSAAVRG